MAFYFLYPITEPHFIAPPSCPLTQSCFCQWSLSWCSTKVLWDKVPENNAIMIKKCPKNTKSKQQQKQPRKNSRGEMLVTFSVWPDWKILHLVWKAIFMFSLSSRGKCIASVNKSFQEQRTLCMGHLAVVHMSLVLWVLFEDYRTLLNHDKNVGYCLSPDFKNL